MLDTVLRAYKRTLETSSQLPVRLLASKTTGACWYRALEKFSSFIRFPVYRICETINVSPPYRAHIHPFAAAFQPFMKE
jgi:hypothetical protein